MRGDFGGEKDPERRRLLEKLSKMGMSFGGGNNMDTEQLRIMVNMMEGIKSGKTPPGSDAEPAPAADRGKSDLDEDIADEDKMEL